MFDLSGRWQAARDGVYRIAEAKLIAAAAVAAGPRLHAGRLVRRRRPVLT